MTKQANELIFISQIHRDGIGVTMLPADYTPHPATEEYELQRLSLTANTYIASSMNSYVVKIKN